MNKIETWEGEHNGLAFKITSRHIEGVGPAWNYYVYLPERLLKERFSEVWLEPRVVKITPESREFVDYVYYKSNSLNVDSWHGGITHYAKHGEVPGFRSVEVGCDYQHLWDREGGYSATLESVTFDCKRTIEELVAEFLTPKATPSQSPQGAAG
jgi:hypothetical protein